jgi:DNA-binding response OmpR family regulator
MAEPANSVRPTAWYVLATGGPAGCLPEIARQDVAVVGDPAAFLRAVAQTRPRLVVVVMPPADAAVLEEVARERRRRPGMRAVFVADAAAIDDRLRALDAGFDDALPDTIDASELAGRLSILAERARRQAPATTLPVTDTADLDLVAHELRRGGTSIHLRPKEFRLLAVLAARPGRAHTRRQLLDRVWGTDHLGDPRTVDVHVRWLRAKLEPDPGCPAYLLTVRGVGYRLDAPDR